VPAKDLRRAKEFNGTTLGLDVVDAPLGVDGADVPAGLEIHIGSATRIHRTPEVRPVARFRDPAGNILSIIEE
jgi:hypothetical protein